MPLSEEVHPWLFQASWELRENSPGVLEWDLRVPATSTLPIGLTLSGLPGSHLGPHSRHLVPACLGHMVVTQKYLLEGLLQATGLFQECRSWAGAMVQQ